MPQYLARCGRRRQLQLVSEEQDSVMYSCQYYSFVLSSIIQFGKLLISITLNLVVVAKICLCQYAVTTNLRLYSILCSEIKMFIIFMNVL